MRYEILHDEDAGNPLQEFDNLGTFACFHRRYNLSSPNCPFKEPDDFEAFCEQEKPIRLPLFLYDHSGITIRTTNEEFRAVDSAGWDWGLLGFVYVTLDDVRKEYHVKHVTKKIREQAVKTLQGEVELYDQYLTGDVWGYVVYGDDGEELDSCWGFYGYDYCEEEAKSMLRWHEEERRKNTTLELCFA